MNFREGQTFDIAAIPMASATTTTSFNLNPVGEGYRKTTTGDERKLLSEGEFWVCRLSRFFFGIVRILLKVYTRHDLRTGFQRKLSKVDCLELPFFRYFKGDMDK